MKLKWVFSSSSDLGLIHVVDWKGCEDEKNGERVRDWIGVLDAEREEERSGERFEFWCLNLNLNWCRGGVKEFVS